MQDDDGKINRVLSWAFVALFVLGIFGSIFLQGCATSLPAVGGKTKYNVEFSDVTADQATNYRMDIRAPAGVELEGLTGMNYDWRPDGSGSIGVSAQSSVDSSTQAALIAEVSKQQIQAFQEAFQAGLNTALNALAPYIGQYLDVRVREGEIKADLGHHAIDAFEGR